MKYSIILNYSDITQGVHRSVYFYENKCEITTYGKIK